MRTNLWLRLLLMLAPMAVPVAHAAEPADAGTREIAAEAYLYGYPVVEMYKTLYAQAIASGGPNYKAPVNRIGHAANVFTPRDTAIITPNSDTPYSFLWMDLRREPLVLSLPAIEKDRYQSVQLVDLYTQNFAYLGTRTTGNGGGDYLVAGPDWRGPTPPGIARVVRSESNIAYALYRTQLFDDADLERVRRIQQDYRVRTLSEYLGQPAPAAPPPIDWPRPEAGMSDSPAMFRYLNFMLQFAPTVDSEKALMRRFAAVGVGPGLPFDESRLDGATRAALEQGIADGKARYAAFRKTQLGTGKVTSADLFGSREQLRDNYMYRYAGAALGIFGNSADEALYPGYYTDDQGQPLDGAKHAYTLRFAPGNLPPADAFWSVTMYDGRSKLLVDNPLDRYLVNSRMLDALVRDADGGITLHVQKDKPAADRAPNWLPAPDGPFYLVMRIYLPRAEVRSGAWRQPPLHASD